MSIGVHKLHKIHCWGWVLLDKTKMAAKGDYRVSFWTRNLDHEVNVCSAVGSWTGQQNEWFLSETGLGFEGLSSKPLPKLPKVLPPSRRPWDSNCLLLCLDFFFTWEPNRFSLKVFWTCKCNLLTSLIWLLDIFFLFFRGHGWNQQSCSSHQWKHSAEGEFPENVIHSECTDRRRCSKNTGTR